jgi:hypothetical protein
MEAEHDLDCNHDHTEQLTRRIDELARELGALRSELQRGSLSVNGERPTAGVATTNSPTIVESENGEVDGGEQASMSRRHALRAAGVLAAGAVAGGAGIISAATPAAAATGTFSGGSPAVTADGGAGAGSVGVSADVQGSFGVAVDAVSSGNDGIGVRGDGDIGVRGDGGSFGVYGISFSGVGIYGDTMGQFGIYGNSGSPETDSAGVSGRSMEGRGLYGYGNVGVYASGFDAGVQATASEDGAAAVEAAGDVGVSIAASQTSLRFSNSAPSPIGSVRTYQKRDIVVDSAGVMWFCVVGGTPGTWRMLSGPSTAGAFTPLTPGRVYDSRLATYSRNGVLGSGQDRTLSVANSYDVNGGPATTNFVPAGATAVFANVTVVETAGNGWLAVNPGGTTTVSASSINWSASGQILANGLSLTLNTNRQITVVNGSPGSTQFIVDVLGYYR